MSILKDCDIAIKEMDYPLIYENEFLDDLINYIKSNIYWWKNQENNNDNYIGSTISAFDLVNSGIYIKDLNVSNEFLTWAIDKNLIRYSVNKTNNLPYILINKFPKNLTKILLKIDEKCKFY